MARKSVKSGGVLVEERTEVPAPAPVAHRVVAGVELHIKKNGTEQAYCGLSLTSPMTYVDAVMPHDHPSACAVCIAKAARSRARDEGERAAIPQPVLVKR